MCVWLFTCNDTRTQTQLHIHIYIYTEVETYPHMHTFTQIWRHTLTSTQTLLHISTQHAVRNACARKWVVHLVKKLSVHSSRKLFWHIWRLIVENDHDNTSYSVRLHFIIEPRTCTLLFWPSVQDSLTHEPFVRMQQQHKRTKHDNYITERSLMYTCVR